MRISIITACYNSATTIGAAMESVVRQSWAEIEYIVVDGGSTDGTVDVVRDFAKEAHGRDIKWLSEPDDGMYDAINKGIRMATGEVIGILNADDFLFNNKVIETIACAFLSSSEPRVKKDVVYTDVQFVKAGSTLTELREAQTLRYYSAKRWKPWMMQWGYMPPHLGVYIRRDAFERLGFYKLGYHIAADYELLIRFLRKGGLTMRYLDLCSVGMRMGGRSTRNWRSNLLLNQEIVRGNRENGYFCCMPMLMPKYCFKIWEFILPYLKNKHASILSVS